MGDADGNPHDERHRHPGARTATAVSVTAMRIVFFTSDPPAVWGDEPFARNLQGNSTPRSINGKQVDDG